MRKLCDLLDRELERHDHHEWIETMQRLTITERTEKRLVAVRTHEVELDCPSIVNQLVSSIPKDVLLRTSLVERRQTTGNQTAQEFSVELRSSVTRRVQLADAEEEYEPRSDCSSGKETLSGESSHVWPSQDELSGESTLKRRRDKIWSGESRNVKNRSEGGDADSIISSDGSESQSWENVSETTLSSYVSEVAIHSLLVEWKQRGLDKELHKEPDRDGYTSDEEGTVVDIAADEIELIAVSKRPTRLLPHATVIHTNLEPLEQDAHL